MESIKSNAVYKQVLADSIGGLMYNVANRGKYDGTEVLDIWDGMRPGEQELAGGIMKGAMDFLRGN